jgi:hypothetical protein
MVRPYRSLLVGVLFSLAAIVGCGNAAPSLADLEGIDQFQRQFDADAGKPRIVLLLSPT